MLALVLNPCSSLLALMHTFEHHAGSGPRSMRFRTHVAVWAAILLMSSIAVAQPLQVVAVSPAANALSAARSTSITITFDRPVNPASIGPASFWAFGRWSGAASGSYSFSQGNTQVTLSPSKAFSAGELVLVMLSHSVQAADGAFLRQGGYSFQFWTVSRPTPMTFTVADQFSTRYQPNEPARSYGGFAADLNEDGWLDLGIVNEISADVRVMLNMADASGQYGPMLQPPNPCGPVASPSETGDFNRDGHTDACIANTQGSSISILLGNGNGTFAPQQLIGVGGIPRGLAVLDVDGDGDMDIVNTNAGSNNISLLINNGQGVFAPPVYIPTVGEGEFAIAAADMNGDGLMDLVIGTQLDERIVVMRGNGNGTFSLLGTQQSGGPVRQLSVGDLDGDGDVDVACVNGLGNVAAVLRNNGTGQLNAPQIYVADKYAGASDFADLDGDGDLDWMISSFFGRWQIKLNNGNGVFTDGPTFQPPQIASCAIIYDVDNDGDVDLALIDELQDFIIIMKNSGTARPADFNGDGVVGPADLAVLLGQWGVCQPSGPCTADIAPPGGDGVVGAGDLAVLLGSWG